MDADSAAVGQQRYYPTEAQIMTRRKLMATVSSSSSVCIRNSKCTKKFNCIICSNYIILLKYIVPNLILLHFLQAGIYELPFFGNVDLFWNRVQQRTLAQRPMGNIKSSFLWLTNPNKLNDELNEELSTGGFPLLYSVMMEISTPGTNIMYYIIYILCINIK